MEERIFRMMLAGRELEVVSENMRPLATPPFLSAIKTLRSWCT